MHLRQENQKIREICKGVLKALGGWVRQSGVLVSPLAGWLAGWLVGRLVEGPRGPEEARVTGPRGPEEAWLVG